MPTRVSVLVLLSIVTFFVGLGRPAITDSDEAFYAEAAREMVEGGDWITPQYNGQYRFEKPVLYYWLAALAYLVAGVSETAARVPSAMAGLGAGADHLCVRPALVRRGHRVVGRGDYGDELRLRHGGSH